MNQIRAIQALNKREIENGVPPEASWHTDYRDTAFVNFGGLPYELSEGDIITIFSQYGEPVFLKLVRDKETGKSKGFGWLKYEDQRSCDLAVDNLGGAEIAGRLVRVDHARYKARDDEDPDEFAVAWADMQRKEAAAKGGTIGTEDEDEDEEVEEARRPMIKEELELQRLIEDHDDDDPMKGFLIEEKKREIEEVLRKEIGRKDKKEKKHRHHHRSHHRSRRDESREEGREDRRIMKSKRDKTPVMEAREDRDRDRDRDHAPERRRTGSRDSQRKRNDDYETRRDRERRRDHEDKERDRERVREGAVRQPRRHEYEDRDRDRDRDSDYKRSRRRSRTRSPQSYRD
ncbi:hypothetical protein F5Y19DRAFT_282327 [Xylariaceae sp. FL1651]|nr:hypothetical protein F5Y19DRAFT_282327 [Xylariaceae sp. FL1651]